MTGRNLGLAIGIVAIGALLAGGGIYVGETDDAPGAALIGLLLFIASIVLGVKVARRPAS